MTRQHHQPAQTAVAGQRFARPTTILLVLLLLALAVVAAGCGATSNESAQPQSADTVHAAWIAAVREGDAEAAVTLTDPELSQREQFAREEVNRMQEYITSPASPTGALQDVLVAPVSDGVGRSVWQFANKRWCYRAELVSRDERWYISRWGQTSVDCS